MQKGTIWRKIKRQTVYMALVAAFFAAPAVAGPNTNSNTWTGRVEQQVPAVQNLGPTNPGTIRGFDPQPDPPSGAPTNPGTIRGFNPQPDPPGNPGTLKGFNPQPEPPVFQGNKTQ